MAIPSRYRGTIDDHCQGKMVVTIEATDGECLVIYPLNEFEEIFNSIYYNNNINKILNNNKFNVKHTNYLINNFINWFENYYIGFNFLTKNELIHILKFYNRNFYFNNFNINKLIEYLKNIILHFLFKFTKFLKYYYYEKLLN